MGALPVNRVKLKRTTDVGDMCWPSHLADPSASLPLPQLVLQLTSLSTVGSHYHLARRQLPGP